MRAITFDIETRSDSAMRGRVDQSQQELTVIAIHDSETGEYSSFVREELPHLWPILEQADVLIGFNSDSFDIPILNRYYPGDLTKIRSLDILVEVQKALGRRIRLQLLAEGTLHKGKSGSGLQAVEWWDQGLTEKVRAYCIEDVRITRELYEYALANHKLKYKDLRDIRDIKIDTSAWNIISRAPLTHTLPI